MQNSILPKVYGYLRVSTGKQELENNKSAILLKANMLALGQDIEWIEEQISGTVNWNNRELGKLMNRINPGDVIITSEVSRFGRKYLDVVQFLAKASEKKIKIYCTNSDIAIDGSINSQLIIFAHSIAAQIEREHISARTKIALQRKKEQGVQLGRKKVMVLDKDLNNINKVKELIEKDIKLKTIAKEMNCTTPTLRKYIKKYNLKK